ncbi:alcohol dehydrogenase catalytic domain-containing protein [Candidatus Bipolaricaulota bacterium]|nr:alcohol dehydrogenase catalytic domain-containing protein [Candidatus Bipolaricaulota bacterium]
MRIAELVEIGKIEVREAERPPRPGPGELLIRTRAVGLCGTDLKAYLRGHPFFPPPCVLGHEFTGTVAEVGAGAVGFAVGDAVVAAPYLECGECALCRAGAGELCANKAFTSGALQEFILLPRAIVERATIHLPEDVDYVTGSLAEPLACAINGIERAAIEPGHSVLVVGGGPMGALLALTAASITTRVLVSEIAPARIKVLERLDLPVVSPRQEVVPERLQAAFGQPRADKVLIAVGVRSVAEEALAWTAPGGTALLFGGLPKDERLTVDPYAIHYQEVSLVGSFGFQLSHFQAAVRWLADHTAEAAHLVTETVSFDAVEQAFALAKNADGLKTVVTFGDPHVP